ncbi:MULTISPECIES: M20/M25/M40 family metallo-hydrolase [Olivibacter]|uniref:M20/M25/M40 family metallo-hydrolase n=1 Tax=Olivibacter jilunii TaxID=985016 RepID=A0ABW6AZZ3_9SPHI|nr:M20/M25/M40 family metallo-hydrolase [Olivibacter sp. UJ_SKK_5.1]
MYKTTAPLNKLSFVLFLVLGACASQKKERIVSVDQQEVHRIISTLADDRLKGRAVFTPEIEEAATFIEGEFKKAGLQPLKANGNDFLQRFQATQIKPSLCEILLDGKELDSDAGFVLSDQAGLNWNTDPEVRILSISASDNFRKKYKEISQQDINAIVCVDESFVKEFNYLKQHADNGRILLNTDQKKKGSLVFVLSKEQPKSFRINYTGTVENKGLANVVGVLPGRSKPNEFVIFSGHYDHIGVLKPIDRDSIANGADDDASGVTAVISLANIFAKQKDNERTLIFAAFTAEESGGYGSQYFSKQLNPDHVVAMINIEMIGKDAKFGANSMYLTGFEKSDLGKILQRNVKGTGFSFYPDPYPEQNLFYRSDNATLAALGVPAHTVSTVQIDKDNYYHTVKDELETLDIKNIVSSINAVALGARSIIAGKDTPTRLEPLKN